MTKIVLQGLPGIGKTTLTKKIATKLTELGFDAKGFYTEELRDSRNYRIGFDIVTLKGERGILARKSSRGTESKFNVGSYTVDIQAFEKVALPVFDHVGSVVIVDEIGKMELLSKAFEKKVQMLLESNVKLLATVPLRGGGPLIQKLKNDKTVKLLTVNASNRDKLLEEIITILTK